MELFKFDSWMLRVHLEFADKINDPGPLLYFRSYFSLITRFLKHLGELDLNIRKEDFDIKELLEAWTAM